MKKIQYLDERKVYEETITLADFMYCITKAHDSDICTLATEDGNTVDIFFDFATGPKGRIHFEEEK